MSIRSYVEALETFSTHNYSTELVACLTCSLRTSGCAKAVVSGGNSSGGVKGEGCEGCEGRKVVGLVL